MHTADGFVLFIMIRFKLIFLLGAVCAAALSCATFKPPIFAPEDEISIFPKGALLYGYAAKNKDRALFDALFESFAKNNSGGRYFFAKTQKANFAIYGDSAKSSSFSANNALCVLSGRGYPVSAAGIYFSGSAAWKKREDGFWYEARSDIAISVKKSLVLISRGGVSFIAAGGTGGIIPPESYKNFVKNAAAGGFFPSAGIFNQYFEENGIPIKLPLNAVIFSIIPQGGAYEISLRLETPGNTQAKLVASLLTIARNAGGASFGTDFDGLSFASIFLANPPQLDGNAVIVKSAPVRLDALRIALRMNN